MKNQFLTPELSIDFKILGYREETLAYYSKNFTEGNFELRFAQDSGEAVDWNEPENDEEVNYISAPLYQQAFEWLRNQHNISVTYTDRKIIIYKIHAGTNSVSVNGYLIPLVREELLFALEIGTDVLSTENSKIDLVVKEYIDNPFSDAMKFAHIDMRQTALKKAIELVYKERYSG